MARPSKQSNKYDFTVEAVPLQLPDGSASGWLGNVRTDTKKVLGVTTEKYGILQNVDLLNAAREALATRGFKDAQERIIVTGDGATLHAEFTFKEKQLAVPGVGDMLGYKLRLVNSFDRTLRASWAMGFLRLACLNGMVTLDSEFAMTAKHSTQISLNFLGEALDKAISGFDSAACVYGELAARSITDEQGVLILANLVKRKALSDVLREDIELLWRQPKRKEDEARNVFNLYNAVTEHLTHKVSGERYEYALRTETKVLHELRRAVNSTSIFDALLRPIEKTKTVEVEATSMLIAPLALPA